MMARKSRAQAGLLWRGWGSPRAWGFSVFAVRTIRLQWRQKVGQEAKNKSTIYVPKLAISRASHICQVERNHLPSCIDFVIYKYWSALDSCFEVGSQSVLLSFFWGSKWVRGHEGGLPGPRPSLHHISYLSYLQHLEPPLKLLFKERIPLD